MRQRNAHILTLFLTVLLLVGWAAPSFSCCNCGNTVNGEKQEQYWHERYKGTIGKVITRMEMETTTMKQWVIGSLWEDNLLPMMMMITEFNTENAIPPVFAIGQFFDAKIQMQTRLDFQSEKTKIVKDYMPSNGICRFGTNIKSLASSERKSELDQLALSQRDLDRGLMNSMTSTQDGRISDKNSRLAQFSTTYCDTDDNDSGLDFLCQEIKSNLNITGSEQVGSTSNKQLNKDIDFVRTVARPWTLDVDLVATGSSVSNASDDETDLFALSSNLFGHKLFNKFAPSALEPTPGSNKITANQKTYMAQRAILAKRSIAENSFNAIAAMKASGTAASREYMVALLESMGAPDEIVLDFMGGDADTERAAMALEYGMPMPGPSDPLGGLEPSYHVQMEILTKKMYQDPQFYINLYDKPINVERKTLAMQAIGLMQKFDMFKSYLRQEMLTSVMLENAIMELEEVASDEASGDTGTAFGAQ